MIDMDGRKEEGRKGLDPQLETYGKVLQHKAEVTVVETIFKHRTTAFDDKTWDELTRCNIDCTGCSVSCTLIGCFFDGDVVPRDYIKELCLAHPEVRSDDCPRPKVEECSQHCPFWQVVDIRMVSNGPDDTWSDGAVYGPIPPGLPGTKDEEGPGRLRRPDVDDRKSEVYEIVTFREAKRRPRSWPPQGHPSEAILP